MNMRSWSKTLMVLVLCTSIFPHLSHAKAPRTLEITPGMVSAIHTAIGYSTIVEFSSKPTQAVLGDQDAFKLEYIGNSITLKPLVPRANSNLFVFTEFDRYSFSVDTVSASNGDYLVRVRNKFISEPVPLEKKTKTVLCNRKASRNRVTVELSKCELSLQMNEPREASLIHFNLYSEKYSYRFQPASLGLRQGKRFVSIENIYLDELELHPDSREIRGTLVLLNEDWRRSEPLTLVFALRGQEPSKKEFKIEVPVLAQIRKGDENGGTKVPDIFKTQPPRK